MAENSTKRVRTKEAKSFGRKTFLFALISLLSSVAFALFNGAMAIAGHSVLYASLAGYYFILSLLRLFIIFYGLRISRKYGGKVLAAKQLRLYIACGAWTIILELALTAAIIHIVTLPQQPYGTVMAIVVATYTFYKVAVAIKNQMRAREYKDFSVQSLRNLALVDAAVSLISLTATLTATFGEPQEMQTLVIAVAAGIGALIIALGSFMIIRGARLLKKNK